MNYSLRTKLSISYVFFTLLFVSLISLLSNLFLEKQFQQYIIKQQEQRNIEFVSLISQQYRDDTAKWDHVVLEHIGMNALEQGLIIKVKEISGKTIWDATAHNNGLCVQMISHMSSNMSSRYKNFNGGYVEAKYPVTHNNNLVGNVEIGYLGPFYFNDNDLAFLNTLNRLLFGVGILAIILALILGSFMAKRLSKPIGSVISTAQQISRGYFGDRITVKSSTKEISQLTTTINNLAETLEKEETLRKRLTADVAHELRTPLATLQSHMEAMIDGIWKPDLERLSSCHEEILRINRMVGDMEKLARYEGDNLILSKEWFDISELIKLIIKNFESDFVKKGIGINFNEEEMEIYADRDKVCQVLVNLISNALKYTPGDGIVEVSVKSSGNNIDIIVKDSGPGIPEEDLPYIFERFYRADKSRNRLTGGTGIGLAIVKAIVEAHKGKVSVHTELNKGTEFIVSLPKQIN